MGLVSLLLLCYLIVGAFSESMRVLQTTSDLSIFKSNSGAELDGSSLFGHRQATVCVRFLPHQFTSQQYQNTLVYSSQLRLLAIRWISDTDIRGLTRVKKKFLFDIWDITIWNHACITIDSITGAVKTFMNGNIVMEENAFFDHSQVADNLTMMNGTKEDTKFGSLFGRLTDVNVWSRCLTEEEAQAWTLCQEKDSGDLVDWRTATWRARGLQEVQVEREEVCRERKVNELRVSLFKRNFDDTVNFASLLGGEMAVATSNQTMQEMYKSFVNQSELCAGRFFTGYSDREEEGTFVNINTGEKLAWDVWEPGEPNNWGGNEDCTDNLDGGTRLNDKSCSTERCPIINMTKTESPKFQMRGLCKNSLVDIFFTFLLKNKTLFDNELLGFKQTKLTWSEDLKRWNIINLVDQTVLAFTNSTFAYPFGTHRWFFTNSTCTDPGQPWRKMNLHQKVKQLGKFCCEDGICIDSEHRCDGNNNCKDYSDEKYCVIVKIPPTYDQEITPSSFQKIGKRTEFLPAEVRTYVEIQNILTLDEEASKIVLRFNISFEWVDYQLNYKFLKENEN